MTPISPEIGRRRSGSPGEQPITVQHAAARGAKLARQNILCTCQRQVSFTGVNRLFRAS